ncbi:hypothetical protein GWI24_12150 [Streptomyces sp. MK37H]|nr:hypothetical protein [Streptomyces sp. MK37H]
MTAEEPAHAEADDHPVACDGQRGYVPPVPAVNSRGGVLTLGACTRRSAACCVNHQVVIGDNGLPHHEAPWIVKVWQNRRLEQYAAAWDPGGRHSPNTLDFGPHVDAGLVEECSACAVFRVGSGRR